MKTLHVGRNPGCDIVYDDPMVSRSHAFIRIHPIGKYEIISKGTNGTKVNGYLIASNSPYPVKRGDDVLFANASRLEWNRVPDPIKPYKLGLIVFLVIVLISSVSFGVVKMIQNYTGTSDLIEPQSNTLESNIVADSINTKEAQEIKQETLPSPEEVNIPKVIKKKDKKAEKKTAPEKKTEEDQPQASEIKADGPRFRSRR